MESDSDPRLKRLLHEWRVPNAPDALEQRVFGQPTPWWRAVMRSRVPIPLPVAIVFSVALVCLAIIAVRDRVRVMGPADSTYDLRGFQPVSSVNVRIERNSDATP